MCNFTGQQDDPDAQTQIDLPKRNHVPHLSESLVTRSSESETVMVSVAILPLSTSRLAFQNLLPSVATRAYVAAPEVGLNVQMIDIWKMIAADYPVQQSNEGIGGV